MEDTPEAPSVAPAAPSVAQPTNTNPETVQTPAPVDLGLTADQAQKFKTFIENSGGFDNAFSKLKSDVSTPKSAQPAPETHPTAPAEQNPTSHAQTPAQTSVPQYKTPAGAITPQEFLAKQYFQSLAGEEKYTAISQGIANGEYLKEMAAFGISPLNPDGSINDEKIRMYLDLKAQTVPAKATGTEPNASPAPTVEYYQVAGDKITTIDQAYAIIQQDAQLKSANMGSHPLVTQAEEFIKNSFKK